MQRRPGGIPVAATHPARPGLARLLARLRALAPALAAATALCACNDSARGVFPDWATGPPEAGVARDRGVPDAREPEPDRGPPPGALRVHTVDVGTGLCVLVEMPDPKQPVLLADCGQDVWKAAGVSGTAAVQYVQQVIAGRAVALVVSHAHADHYSLVDNVLGPEQGGLAVTTVWLGGELDDYRADGERLRARLVPLFAKSPGKAHHDLPATYRSPYPAGEAQLTFGNVKAYVLAVNATRAQPGGDVNGTSLVLALRYGAFFAVLPGDAEGTAQALSVKNAGEVGLPLGQTVLLAASHHGSNASGSNDAAWLQATRPRVVTYSAGRDQDPGKLKMHNGHPHKAVVSRVEALPSLARAQEHELFQGETDDAASRRRTSRAHYLSASNGVVVVSSTGQPGDLHVSCVALPGTTRETTCALE